MPYIDPGLGSMVFQVAIAGAVSVLVIVGKLRNRIARLFKRLLRR